MNLAVVRGAQQDQLQSHSFWINESCHAMLVLFLVSERLGS